MSQQRNAGGGLAAYLLFTVDGAAALCALAGSAAANIYLLWLFRDVDSVTGNDRVALWEADKVRGPAGAAQAAVHTAAVWALLQAQALISGRTGQSCWGHGRSRPSSLPWPKPLQAPGVPYARCPAAPHIHPSLPHPHHANHLTTHPPPTHGHLSKCVSRLRTTFSAQWRGWLLATRTHCAPGCWCRLVSKLSGGLMLGRSGASCRAAGAGGPAEGGDECGHVPVCWSTFALPLTYLPTGLAAAMAAFNRLTDNSLDTLHEGCLLLGFLSYKVPLILRIADDNLPKVLPDACRAKSVASRRLLSSAC